MTERNKDLTAAQMLLEARTSGRRKREISTISKLLCIREEYLVALENGKYDAIPELVYILGFARNYAMELGLDPNEIVAKIKKEMGVESEFETVTNTSNKEDESDSEEDNINLNKLQKGMTFEKISKFIYKNWKWLLAVLIAIIVLILGISFVSSLNQETETYNEQEQIETSVKKPEYKHPIREKFGTENAETSNVVIQASQESWVKIEDSRGNTVFSRVLVAGDIYYVPAGEKYKATFGNAGGVDIWVNGVLVPKIGAVNTRKSGVVLTPYSLMLK